MERVLSITALMRALAGLARCDRPTNAPFKASSDQPGRFAQGPDENCARAGRTDGFGLADIWGFSSGGTGYKAAKAANFREWARSLGTAFGAVNEMPRFRS
jgi:hypothetical protein